MLYIMAFLFGLGDAIGTVILTTKDEKVRMGEMEMKLAASAASFLGRQLEQ